MDKSSGYLLSRSFMFLFIIMIFNRTTDFEWLTTYHVLAIVVLFGGIGFVIHGYQEHGLDGLFVILLFIYLLCMLVLIGVIFQQRGVGFSEPGRAVKLVLIVMLLLFFLCVSVNQRRYLRQTGVYLLAFTVLILIHLSHSVEFAPNSGFASLPLLAGFMMGMNLFILPRYVSSRTFLWILSLLSNITVLLGILVYHIGSYSFLTMNVDLADGMFTPLFMNKQLHALQSVFENPNMLGIVTFAGTVSAAILIHRLFPDIRDRIEPQEKSLGSSSTTVSTYSIIRSLALSCLAGGMLLINSIGLYFSQSRASFLAAAVSLTLYVSYVVLGRRSLPYTMAGLVGVVSLFVLTMPIVGVNPGGRFSLWAGTIEAFLNDPSLFGAGLITPGEYIAPYVSEPYKGQNPHNSYLVIFLRSGFIGGVAYLGIVVGSLLTGVLRNQRVDVSALALAFGFGIHQTFEGYTLFQHEISSIIATLSFGFLILSGFWIETDWVPQ